jgi:hypothetical protein
MRRSTATVSALLTSIALAAPVMLAASRAHAAPQRARKAARSGASSIALRSVPLPDGSGTLRLPAGWRIGSAQQGMVSAAGPHGSVDLGIWLPVMTPEAAAQMYTRPSIVAPYGDVVQAIRQVVPQFVKASGLSGWRLVRVIGRAPASAPNGKAEFVHIESEFAGRGRFQTVALVMMMPTGGGNWIFYYSSVTSPSKSFARNLPVLAKIWGSWKVSDHVYQQRLSNALASMKETGRILRETHQNTQDAYDRSNRAWGHNIRGTWVYEDTETGKRYETPYNDMDQRLETKNRAAGYERYRQIPYGRLNRR